MSAAPRDRKTQADKAFDRRLHEAVTDKGLVVVVANALSLAAQHVQAHIAKQVGEPKSHNQAVSLAAATVAGMRTVGESVMGDDACQMTKALATKTLADQGGFKGTIEIGLLAPGKPRNRGRR